MPSNIEFKRRSFSLEESGNFLSVPFSFSSLKDIPSPEKKKLAETVEKRILAHLKESTFLYDRIVDDGKQINDSEFLNEIARKIRACLNDRLGKGAKEEYARAMGCLEMLGIKWKDNEEVFLIAGDEKGQNPPEISSEIICYAKIDGLKENVVGEVVTAIKNLFGDDSSSNALSGLKLDLTVIYDKMLPVTAIPSVTLYECARVLVNPEKRESIACRINVPRFIEAEVLAYSIMHDKNIEEAVHFLMFPAIFS